MTRLFDLQPASMVPPVPGVITTKSTTATAVWPIEHVARIGHIVSTRCAKSKPIEAAHSSKGVLGAADRFQVGRIDTTPMQASVTTPAMQIVGMTEVVKVHADRYRPIHLLIREAMSWTVQSFVIPDAAIPRNIKTTCPWPTRFWATRPVTVLDQLLSKGPSHWASMYDACVGMQPCVGLLVGGLNHD